MKTFLFLKKAALLPACICFLITSVSTAFADDTSDALNALQSTIEKEPSPKQPQNAGDMEGRPRDISAAMLAQLRAALSQGESPQLDEILNQIPIYLKSDAVRKAVDKVRSALNAERATRDKEVSDKIDAGIAAASKAVQGAKKAADLDQILNDLGNLQEQFVGQYSEAMRGRTEKVRRVRQFVLRWQDYLANRDEGNSQQALQSLQNIQNEDVTDIIPRSEIIARIGELSKAKPAEEAQKQETSGKKIREIVDQTNTLDAIPAALDALAGIQRSSDFSNRAWNDPITAVTNDLTAIYQSYSQYRAGLPSHLALGRNQQQSAEVYNIDLPLRVQLLRLVIPRVLEADENDKMDANETIQKYLNRMMARAQQTANVGLIGRVQELQNALNGDADAASSMGSAQNSTVSVESLKTLLAAQNQEAAGQFAPAVISYETALKTCGELAPAQEIGARLDAIKKAHPEDFEKGMQLFLSNEPAAQPQSYNRYSNTITIPGSIIGKTPSSPAPMPANTP